MYTILRACVCARVFPKQFQYAHKMLFSPSHRVSDSTSPSKVSTRTSNPRYSLKSTLWPPTYDGTQTSWWSCWTTQSQCEIQFDHMQILCMLCKFVSFLEGSLTLQWSNSWMRMQWTVTVLCVMLCWVFVTVQIWKGQWAKYISLATFWKNKDPNEIFRWN